MRRYQVYKNIRKRALIFGLPLPYFAILMIIVIASLLIIIFSFSILMVIGAALFDVSLYIALARLVASPNLFHFSGVFPASISNKQINTFNYEQN